MRKFTNQLFLSLFSIVLFIALSAETTPPVTPTPAPQSLPANCYTTLIQLNGDNPATFTCKTAGKVVNGHIEPYVNGQILSADSAKEIEDCRNSADPHLINAYLESKTQGLFCFSGTGYLGFNIIQGVYNIADTGTYRVWFMYYTGGPGIKTYLDEVPSTSGNTSEIFNPTVGVTQVCINC